MVLEKIYLGALLCLGCFKGTENILQRLVHSWFGDKLWNPFLFAGQKRLVMRPDDVAQVQMWSHFTISNWRLGLIYCAHNSSLCGVAGPDQDDWHVEIPRCCL